MTNKLHPWERLRNAQDALGCAGSLAQNVEIILDNARVRADQVIFVDRKGEGEITQWHDVALAHVRKQLLRFPSVKDWFAQHGVTP